MNNLTLMCPTKVVLWCFRTISVRMVSGWRLNSRNVCDVEHVDDE